MKIINQSISAAANHNILIEDDCKSCPKHVHKPRSITYSMNYAVVAKVRKPYWFLVDGNINGFVKGSQRFLQVLLVTT